MNTIRELKQQEKYKNMLKRKNKEKNVYKTQNSTLKIKYEGIKKLLEKKDKEIERLNNIINEALGIANERVNYYHHINNKEQLENWEDIFDVLVKKDSDKE